MSKKSSYYLYIELAEYMMQQIYNGAYAPASRLPSIRELCRKRKISSNTVLNAYRLLESKDIVESRSQSGFYVSNKVKSMNLESKHIAVQPIARDIQNSHLVQILIDSPENKINHSFGVAVISPELIPMRDITKIVSDVLHDKSLLARSLSYSEAHGEPELRGAIARRYSMRGLSIPLDEITITNGCLDALSLCLRVVTKPGDTVAVESPAYYGLLLLLESLGLHAAEIRTDQKQGLCLDELEKQFNKGHIKACLFSANYQNPLGFCMSNESKQKLVELGDQYQVPLIEDDIFSECSYTSSPPHPVKYFDKEGNVMLCSSFSKSVAPGLRLGWVAGGRYTEKITELKLSNNLATSSLYQFVMQCFLDSHRFDKHIAKLRRSLAQQTMRMRFAVKEYFPKGTCITQPNGGFVLWVELPIEYNADTIQQQAANESIEVMQGSLFSVSGRYKNCLRLSCGYLWTNKLEYAIRRLGELTHKNKSILN